MAEEIKKKEELDPQEKSFRRRKDMIKNFIIVFLVVMLVLTFFSNTIMNYSLPQVAVQYIQPGTITSVIRGEGTVESGDPYSVMVKQQKTVSKIHIKVGSIVKEGDTLISLDGEESEELKAAKEKLETAEDALDAAKDAYNKALLDDVALASIAAAQGELNIDELRKKITNAQNALKAAEDNLKACEAALTNLKNQEDIWKATQKNDNGLSQLKLALDNAETAKDNAQSTLKDAETEYTSAQEAYDTAKSAEDTAKATKDETQAKLNDLNASQPIIDAITTGATVDLTVLTAGTDEELKLALLRRENEEFNTAINDGTGSSADVKLAYQVWIYDETEKLTNTTTAYNNAVAASTAAKTSMDSAKAAYDAAAAAYNSANEAYLKAKNDYDTAEANSGNTSSPYEYDIAVAEANRNNAEKDRDNKKEALAEILGDVSEIEDLNQKLKEISKCEEDVDEQKEEVAKIETESSAEEVKSPINGTILSVNVTSGKKTSPDEAVVTIQPEGQGFTMSFSVDNDKAKTITVGDEASVANSWWYNDVTGVVATIRPDPNDSNRKKLVTLNLQGSLTAGQTLTMSISSKTSNYDMIVPSSAIRNDNKGDFVLVVQSKSSPLGNRYFAIRYDIEILATDDVQTAIKGAFEGYEPVVTTSTKDITEGQQIRLSDN